MMGVQAAQFKLRAVSRKGGPHPAARPPCLKRISRLRQVDQMHSGRMLFYVPVVSVAINESFNLRMFAKQIRQCQRIAQAHEPGYIYGMMAHDQRGLVRPRCQLAGQPVQLGLA